MRNFNACECMQNRMKKRRFLVKFKKRFLYLQSVVKSEILPNVKKGKKKNFMVVVAQLVRALVCGTRGRGFESHLPPQ